MLLGRSLPLLCAAVLAVAAPVTAVAASAGSPLSYPAATVVPDPQAEPLGRPRPVNDDAEMRQQFGFNAQPATEDVSVLRSGLPVGVSFAVIPAEYAELARRQDARNEMQALDAAFRRAGNYAGFRVIKATGVVEVMLRNPTPEQLALVREATGGRFTVRTPTFSSQEIDEATALLRARSDEEMGVVQGYGKRTGEDFLRVTLTAQASSADRAVLEAIHPAIKTFVSDAMIEPAFSRYTNTGDVLGGKYIRRVGDSCTASTSASAGGSYFAITAGHCGYRAYRYLGTTGSTYIGRGQLRNPYVTAPAGSTQNCDCQAIGPFPNYWAATNAVPVDNGNLYRYTRIASSDAEYVDARVCISGKNMGAQISCGTVTSVNHTTENYGANGAVTFLD